MRVNLGVHPFTYPQPVYIIGTYDENGHPNAMNAAWGMISDMDKITICLSAMHKTTNNLLKTNAFTVSIGTVDTVLSCDYVGVISGNSYANKFEDSGFTQVKSEFVNAPIIQELPMCLECTVLKYDKDTELLTGSIKNVSCDDAYMTNGKIDPSLLKPIAFDPVNMKYLELGNAVGNAFKDGRKLIK